MSSSYNNTGLTTLTTLDSLFLMLRRSTLRTTLDSLFLMLQRPALRLRCHEQHWTVCF